MKTEHNNYLKTYQNRFKHEYTLSKLQITYNTITSRYLDFKIPDLDKDTDLYTDIDFYTDTEL